MPERLKSGWAGQCGHFSKRSIRRISSCVQYCCTCAGMAESLLWSCLTQPCRAEPTLRFEEVEVVRLGYIEFSSPLSLRHGRSGPEVWPLFPVPSCILFATRHDGATAAPLPEHVGRVSRGTLPRRDADAVEAKAQHHGSKCTLAGGSLRRRQGRLIAEVFRNGATLFPRRLMYCRTCHDYDGCAAVKS